MSLWISSVIVPTSSDLEEIEHWAKSCSQLPLKDCYQRGSNGQTFSCNRNCGAFVKAEVYDVDNRKMNWSVRPPYCLKIKEPMIIHLGDQ
jgi:hypothetical protein